MFGRDSQPWRAIVRLWARMRKRNTHIWDSRLQSRPDRRRVPVFPDSPVNAEALLSIRVITRQRERLLRYVRYISQRLQRSITFIQGQPCDTTGEAVLFLRERRGDRRLVGIEPLSSRSRCALEQTHLEPVL